MTRRIKFVRVPNLLSYYARLERVPEQNIKQEVRTRKRIKLSDMKRYLSSAKALLDKGV